MSHEPGDEQLVERARAGHEDAFDGLVRRHRRRVYGLALRLLGSPSEAEEVTQDTFVQLYRKLAGFRGEARLSTWLYRVTTNAARMHRRRACHRHECASLEDHLPRADDHGPRAPRADELVERGQLLGAIRDAVARLPALYRETFVLRDLHELSTEETAATLGLESGVVRTRLHRARQLIRELVAPVGLAS